MVFICLLSGVDEDVIVAVLAKRNNEQRQKIKTVYEASVGKVSEENPVCLASRTEV